MKRVFTLFCAFVLLLSCFSGVAVSAAEADNVPSVEGIAELSATETTVAEETSAEEPAEEPTKEPAEEPAAAPAQAQEGALACHEIALSWFEEEETEEDGGLMTYGADLEYELSDAFMTYLKTQMGKCMTTIDISAYKIPYSSQRATQLSKVIFYETPELFHAIHISVWHNYVDMVKLEITYRAEYDSEAEYKACLKSMKEGADYLLRGVKGNTALSEVEKALVLHDRLAVWVEYDLQNVNTATAGHKIFNAYGALGEGLAVCQGYALAYMYLLEQVGIESDLCTSSALWHAWNIVYIGGKPYYTDVTWDDATNNWPSDTPFFDDYGRVHHVNFLRSYEGMWETNHKATDYPVVSAGTEYDSGWWWMDTVTSIELIGNELYHLDMNDGYIWKLNSSGWSRIYQTAGFNGSKLASAGRKLFLSEEKKIRIIDLDAWEISDFYTPEYCSYGGYIEGMKYEKGLLHYQVRYNNWSHRGSVEYVDASTAVQITQQPKNVVASNGGTAKITLKATGDGLTYTWYYAKKGATSWTKSGNQTTNTLSLKMSSSWNGARFYCVVADLYGNSVTSDVAQMIMGNLATIKTQPTTAVAPNGKTAKIAVKATGDGLKYTWYYAKKGATSWSKSGNQTTNTLSLKMSSSWNGAKFYCVVTDKYGSSVKTNAVKMYMGNPAKIATQPKNAVVVSGKTAKFTVKATGDGLKYTWYYAKKGATSWTKSGNQKTNVLSLKMSSSWNGAKFYCVVTDKYGTSVKTGAVSLTLAKLATIVTQPVDTVSPKDKTVKVTVKATGDGLKYQWYYAKKGSSKFTKTSVTSATYSVKMTSSVNGRKVYCVVSDKYGNSVKTKTVTLTQVDTKKVVAKSWKGTYEYISDGRKYSISNLSIKITSAGKVTLKVPKAGVGYNKGTFTYKLKYVKCVGDTVYYQFTNNIETLSVTYKASNKKLTVYLSDDYWFEFKIK